MSLEDVEKKVMASAEREARKIVAEAEAEAKADLERRGDALRDAQRRSIEAAKADADAGLERDVTSRRAQHGMKILQAKNEVLDAIFASARDRILRSDGFDYDLWLARQVRLACEKGSGVIHCNQRDRKTVEAGADGVTVETDNNIQGGVLLVGDSFDLDLTLGAQLADLRTDLTVSLAERLFADLPALGEQK